MLPGKTYRPDDVLKILKRRFWVLVLPFAIVAAGTAVAARKLPDRFRAEAVILVVPQQVPESFVKSTFTTRIEDQLGSIQQQILSRTQLEKIIVDFNLYPEERKAGIMQDVVDRMQTRDVKVQVYKGDAFKVSYEGAQPRLVTQVADRLASLFIEESLRDRTNQTEGTSNFLEAQLEDSRRRLIEQEKKLEEYRMKYRGQLPTQLDSNLHSMQNVQMQIQSLVDSLNRVGDRRLLVQRQLADVQAGLDGSDDPAKAAKGGMSDISVNTTTGSTADRLTAAKNALAALRQRGLTEKHPDVQAMQRLVDDLQRKFDAELLQRPLSAGEAAPAESSADASRQKRFKDLQTELQQLDKQAAEMQAEQSRLRAISDDLQQRIDAVPARESDLTELMRDYGTLQKLYETLLARKEEANISANLERRQIGEQFRLLDPAHLPEKPVSPNRKAITLVGMAIGLGLGLGLVVLLEYRDSSFRNDEDLRSVLSVPILAVVPLMRSEADRRRDFRKRWTLNLAFGSTVTACLAVLAYTFVR